LLANSFRKSRDNWKRKCQSAKAQMRVLRDRIRDLEASRLKWRRDTERSRQEQQRLQEEVARLQSQLAVSAEAIAQAEKKPQRN
jgi:chromosome segregation ATPase